MVCTVQSLYMNTTGRWPSSHHEMSPVASLGQVPPRELCPTPPWPAQLFGLSQVANQPLDQLTHNLCLTLCLVHICKTIHDQDCHSGVHHLVPSRQDSLQSGVEVVTNPCSIEGVWLCSQNLTRDLLSTSSELHKETCKPLQPAHIRT